MYITIEFIDKLAAQLPNADQFIGTSNPVEFIFEGRHFKIIFYIVSESEDSAKHWLWNPYHIRPADKDGSRSILDFD